MIYNLEFKFPSRDDLAEHIVEVWGNEAYGHKGRIAVINGDRIVTFDTWHRGGWSDDTKTAVYMYSLWANPLYPCKNGVAIFNRVATTMYIITGKDRSGKRFNPIWTATPQHYNIWSGTLWKYVNGVRKRIKVY